MKITRSGKNLHARAAALFFVVGFFCTPRVVCAEIGIPSLAIQSDGRKELMREYALLHYGLDDWRLRDPLMIVIHYTGTDSDRDSLSAFSPERLGSSRPDIVSGGSVNVGIHYVITRDGTIWSLLPETDMGRHAIGYNHVALGIEMTGSRESAITEAQTASCAALVSDIARRNPSVRYLCGHHEYMEEGRAHRYLYTELMPGYAPTIKADPGVTVMAALRKILENEYSLRLED